jgi:hypothetical protein
MPRARRKRITQGAAVDRNALSPKLPKHPDAATNAKVATVIVVACADAPVR